MLQTSRNRIALLYAAIIASLTVVFLVDLYTPNGFAIWIMYMFPVALCLFAADALMPLIIAFVASILLIISYVASTGITGTWAIPNRMVGGATTWLIAVVAYRYILSRHRVEAFAWMQAGLMQLATAVRAAPTAQNTADGILKSLLTYTGAKVGTLYQLEKGQLRRLSTWALPDNVAPLTLQPGDGLAGQAIVAKSVLTARDLPPSHLQIGTTVGSSPTAHVTAAPLTAEGDIVGVIELGFAGSTLGYGSENEMLARVVQLLEMSAEPAGIALQTARYRSRLELLLAETQHQAEELQVQQEELRVSNEELEERGRALMDSQARLESQQTELEETNVQLEEHTQRLEQQKRYLLDTQRDLMEKTGQLERANQYKSEFLANMSHELRTPLNSSLILAKLLQDNKPGNLSAEQVRYASTIYSANTDLLSLINDILDLAKVESGHMGVEAEPITLEAIIQSLHRTFDPIAQDRRVALRIERGPDAPLSLTTDHQRLMQILKNLLSNAFKFTPSGEVSLWITGAAPAHVQFAIQDTGIGIAAEHLGAIFDAFRQADGTTSRKYGGSGLGLSISREFATLLGGDIDVTSELAKGSTFTLTLPVVYTGDGKAPDRMTTEFATPAPQAFATPPSSVRADSRPQDGGAISRGRSFGATAPAGIAYEAAAETDSGSAGAAHLAKVAHARQALPTRTGIDDDRDQRTREHRLILVVEDDFAFARILYDLAHELDFDCVHASTGADGIALARQLQPSGILLDVGLPDDSGLTVLERLKRDPQTRHLPIHMISINDHTEAALHLGAIGYSLKPTARDDMVSALKHLEAKLDQSVRRILVVEDDPLLRENITLLLNANGVEINAVGTIADALDKLFEMPFDCVVMDLTLPDGSGYDLLKQLADRAPQTYPPVIVYTGRSLTADEERRLRYYSKSIIIKGAKSPERLLDEVTLFLHSVESDLPADQQRMLRQARQRDAAFEGRKILLAEDDVRNIFALSHVIEPLGAKLEIARNGREALEKLAQDPDIELVLMDIMMPEMDGLTAIQEIRKRAAHASLPIIALTAKAMSSDRQRCLEAGANDYISKPIEVDKLLSLCRVWMPH
ncbi:response regulator [Robbsia andropogonis]|uniref:hybrid sensor histidine kinase/response regulator n=1 Tax=Robbsia andropogonis TaxID=28092 RepID=UPI003D1F3B3D